MVMISGIEAATAAGEILSLVNEEIEIAKKNDRKDVLEVLEKIKKKAEEIKGAGEAGWY